MVTRRKLSLRRGRRRMSITGNITARSLTLFRRREGRTETARMRASTNMTMSMARPKDDLTGTDTRMRMRMTMSEQPNMEM